MISGKTIFISPLDWGLGHATRCVQLIRELSLLNKIVIGTTNLNVNFFEHHFPELQKIALPTYSISYSKHLPIWLKLTLQWPKINSVIKREKACLEKIISDFKIDVVISDNRFDLRFTSALFGPIYFTGIFIFRESLNSPDKRRILLS